MSPSRRFHAFVDEAGQRSVGAKSSEHFIMSAVVVEDVDLGASAGLLANLRQDLNRRPGDTLHWQNLKGHSLRLHAAKTIGEAPFLTVVTVVVCKRFLSSSQRLPDEHHAYLFTLRFLLERLSWFTREREAVLDFTLAAITRFKLATLREYEAKLRTMATCRIAWAHLDHRGGRIDQPSRVEQLQLADIAASATFKAFELDEYGNTERRYLVEMARRLYRRPPGALTSYGLKMHPWTEPTRAAYPWVAAL